MRNTRETNIKNRTYYFFGDMINIENFNPGVLKLDKKSYKNIGIYYAGYIKMKNSNYVKINRVNALYFIIGEVHGSLECNYIEEKNGNKLLFLQIKTKRY